jgi:predicted DNA-binding protein (UPF0251 family)
VLHRCDQPPCINPAHLFLGTRSDNVRDAVRKGRSTPQYGEFNPQAKLCAPVVQAIRRAAMLGCSQASLGRQYGVRQSTIWKILRRERWKHVP